MQTSSLHTNRSVVKQRHKSGVRVSVKKLLPSCSASSTREEGCGLGIQRCSVLPFPSHCDSRPLGGCLGETGRGGACGSGRGCSIRRHHRRLTGLPPQSYSGWGSRSESGTFELSFWGLGGPPPSRQQEHQVSCWILCVCFLRFLPLTCTAPLSCFILC